MQIFVDLDTRKLRRSVSNSSPVTTLDFKRGDTELMEIFYVQNNAQVQLAAGAVISFGAKIKDAYDGAALVFEDDFTLSGSGATAKYSANPSFNTVPLDDALMVDDNPANDLKLLDLMGEITWNDDGVITSSVTFAVRVNNDVLRGDEGTPSSLPDPADWMPAALTFAGANPNDSVDGLTISGIVTPSAANGFYTEGVEVNGYPSYARAGYKIFRTTVSYTWMLTTDTVPFATNKFVTTQNVATPDLVTEWTPISGNEGELDISLVASLTGTHLGQLCKASAAWWRWNGTSWIEEIPDASLTIAKTSGLQAALDGKAPARKYLNGNRAITDTLKTTLDAGLDAGFGVITDSTGNATDEWIYLAAADIAAAHPNHRVLYRLWNDTTKKYDLTTIQSGVGGDRHINFPTGALFGYYMPASNMLETFAGNDLEIQAEFSLSAGHGSGYLILLSWGSGNGRGWLEMDPTTKVFNLNWSEDASGTTLRTATSTAGIPSFVLDQKYTVKATLDINDGSGNRVAKFWYSTNSGSTWTQLGSTITVATVTTTYWDGTNVLLINSRGSAPIGGAKFYRVQLYKGIDGQPLLPERIDLWQRNASGSGNTASLSGAPVLHIDNIANSGWGLNSHLTLQTAPQTAYIERGRLFWAISSSHNDTGMSFGEWGRKADELVAIVRTKSGDDPPIVLITQNPQNGAAVFKESHNNRCVQQLRVGSARGGPVIDANGAWRDYGDYSALMNADGIHPLAAGSQLTKSAILGALGY